MIINVDEVKQVYGLNVLDHSLFIFTNKSRNRLKILYYENNGFWLFFHLLEHVQYVYTCDSCEKVKEQSPMYKCEMPEPVIYKSFASPSILANIIDRKFNQSIPLYRQEVVFQQAGLQISRQTMANWMIKLYD